MAAALVSTTDSGIPVVSDQYSPTVGADGPIPLQDDHPVEKTARSNRKRIPERMVHAEGSGA
ncbi:catalase [Streptomyces griseofuscus]|uniref:catalase n=1 Tax=Streptomyces griseofuscus TaxID=146922 RepID=UPI00372036BB